MSVTRLELAPSSIVAGAIGAAHAAAGVATALALPGPAGVALAGAFLALGLAAAWSRGLLGAASSVRALELAGPKMCVETKNHDRFEAELGARRHVGRFLVTLPVRRPVRRTLLVTRDMMSGEDFRRLRLWTLWAKLPARGVARKQLPA